MTTSSVSTFTTYSSSAMIIAFICIFFIVDLMTGFFNVLFQNNVLELWSLFDFLMPGFLGTEKQFQARFGKPILQSRDAKSSSKEQEAGMYGLVVERFSIDCGNTVSVFPRSLFPLFYCNSETRKIVA